MSRVSDVSKNPLSAAKNRLLVVTDGIIALSLMRKGTRPKPGQRQPWPEGLREDLYRAQARRCVYCGKQLRLKLGFSHIDHITPVNQGGANDRVNLQLLCPGCNGRKSDRNDAEFRYRYRSLIPQGRGPFPSRTIRQAEFDRVAKETSDAATYTRFKLGKYLTAAQKVNGGAIATGVVVAALLYVPIYEIASPEDTGWLSMTSLAAGLASGAWVRLRARWTGKDRED